MDRKLNWESKEDEHAYRSESEWEEYFNQLGLKIEDKQMFASEAKSGAIPHAFYVLSRKRE